MTWDRWEDSCFSPHVKSVMQVMGMLLCHTWSSCWSEVKNGKSKKDEGEDRVEICLMVLRTWTPAVHLHLQRRLLCFENAFSIRSLILTINT